MKLSMVMLLLSTGAIASAQAISSTQPAVIQQTAVTGTPSQATPDQIEHQRKQLQSLLEAARQSATQAGCPIVLTSATFAPYYMPVRSGTEGAPGSLDLGFRNQSGKAIASVQLRVHLLVKRSVYDMQAYPLEIALTARGTGITDGQLEQLQHLALPTGLHPTIVSGVTLAEVTYSDGSTWLPTLSPSATTACSLQQGPTQQFVAK